MWQWRSQGVFGVETPSPLKNSSGPQTSQKVVVFDGEKDNYGERHLNSGTDTDSSRGVALARPKASTDTATNIGVCARLRAGKVPYCC